MTGNLQIEGDRFNINTAAVRKYIYKTVTDPIDKTSWLTRWGGKEHGKRELSNLLSLPGKERKVSASLPVILWCIKDYCWIN